MAHPILDRRTLLLGLAAGALGLGAPRRSHAQKPRVEPAIPLLPLSVSVADAGSDDGPSPVRNQKWVDDQVAAAEKLFGAQGVHFRRGELRTLPSRFAKLETKDDRDALAAHIEGGKINVFVVGSLRDVDDPDLFRMGVHWRKLSNLKKRYVIVSSTAMPTTLAHELGHFFGNGHSTVVNNVMSYTRTSDEVFFDAAQIRKIRSFARIYIRTKELIPLPDP